MRITIPQEILDEIEYDQGNKIWIVIYTKPSEFSLKRLLSAANAVLERIEGSLVSPISRTIPIQEFKEEILCLLDTE